MPADRPGEDAPTYSETLHAPVSWWLAAVAGAVVVWWVFVFATPMIFAIAMAVVAGALACAGVWSYGRVSVGVGDGVVHAGRARIEATFCADATPLDPERTAAVRGPEADARAYLLLRPYIATAVRIELADSRDPTPYWLVSSRHPRRLAAAIAAARTDNGADTPGD